LDVWYWEVCTKSWAYFYSCWTVCVICIYESFRSLDCLISCLFIWLLCAI
jgi:hypothetical protein